MPLDVVSALTLIISFGMLVAFIVSNNNHKKYSLIRFGRSLSDYFLNSDSPLYSGFSLFYRSRSFVDGLLIVTLHLKILYYIMKRELVYKSLLLFRSLGKKIRSSIHHGNCKLFNDFFKLVRNRCKCV